MLRAGYSLVDAQPARATTATAAAVSAPASGEASPGARPRREIAPHYLLGRDLAWLEALLDEHDRHVGRRRRELRERLLEPLPVWSPAGKLKVARLVLAGIWTDRPASAVKPEAARAAVFEAAASMCLETRGAILARAAAALGTSPEEIEEALFSDLPGERRLGERPEGLSASELALRSNLAIAQSLLRRAVRVRISAAGGARALVRQAKLAGLICTVSPGAGPEAATLEISGPFSLFRRTLVYGRSLAALLPRLAWCDRFDLSAECSIDGELALLRVRSGDPIFPGSPPRPFDSRLEERFARDFRRAALDWELVREPEAVPAGDTLVFPDFSIVHRRQRGRRWLLEIAGFWTEEYVRTKLARLRAARLANLILCLDEERCCSQADLPAGPLIRFRRRIDPAEVLKIIERQT
jgi:predicted nuclease of restriction endonuclease-like RecB superfamily